MISYFIKVAKEMRELQNFDGMMAIINGLENSSVLRLKQTWSVSNQKEFPAIARINPRSL